MFKKGSTLAIFSILTLLVIQAAPALAAAGDITLVSLSSGGVQGNDESISPIISADGRFVVFYSIATNLVPGDTNDVDDIFVRDRSSGTTVRLSVATDGTQANGASYSEGAGLSSSGRYVGFYSEASNLVAGDTNDFTDVFLRDRDADGDGVFDEPGATATILVSAGLGGTPANGDSFIASVSADGRYVAFHSDASNLVAGDTNGFVDVFLRDRDTDGDGVFDETGATATILVSVGLGGVQANSDSEVPSISADGRRVTFASIASNLVAGDTNEMQDIFVRDIRSGATTRISVTTAGGEADGNSELSVISADGRYVAFQSYATNLVTGDTNAATDIFLHDTQSGTTTRISVTTAGGEADGDSDIPSISADGRYVLFSSGAINLVAGDTNWEMNIFVRDTRLGVTLRVSQAADGTQANGESFNNMAGISADGRYVVFQSEASNLVAGDANDETDVFVYELDIDTLRVVFGEGSVPAADGAALAVGPSQLLVHFSENVLGDGSQHAANSLGNYLLLRPGPNGVFDTTITADGICTSAHLVNADDEKVDLSGVTYDSDTSIATLTIGASDAPLARGRYRLYVCGAASIQDAYGNSLNGGANTAISFTVTGGSVPGTGFAPNRVTALPAQTVSYADLGDLWLEIPALGVQMPIVGVPQSNGTWDVSWLGKEAGWLNGSAFPTWAGNSVITGHVYDASGKPGPFAGLNRLWYGSQVIVHAWGGQYVYAVRSVMQVAPGDTAAMMKHQELPWLTLVTCRGYDEASNSYKYRVLVRAVLVEVK